MEDFLVFHGWFPQIAFKGEAAYYQISFDVKKGFTEVHQMIFLSKFESI